MNENETRRKEYQKEGHKESGKTQKKDGKIGRLSEGRAELRGHESRNEG